ncbi:ATP-grasp domain-containing protein [Pseudonocardia adelaidensis]|uniref:Carbamoyl phosphate synthase large subunit n=1 Tax=Pseudonocardia adelaidensis TaxID=648754 RepID=A0ABP9NZB6_9PSEU
MAVAAFVAPFLMPATVRFVAAAARIPDVRLGVITTVPAEHVPPELARHLAAHWRVDDPLDPHQIVEAAKGLSGQIGRVERLVGALEQLQVPLAYAREALGIPGMDVETAYNVRDKARMKQVLRAAGVPCARHQLATDAAEALAFADAVGFPLVAKPPAGAGAQATYRLDDAEALRSWLAATPPREDAPGLLEEFLAGDEHTFDSVTLGGRTVWASVADYVPPPLDVLRNPWIQWTVLLPRELDDPRYAGIAAVGPAALRALGVRDALTHMEWFRRPDGSVAVSEVAARPPGAQLSSMLGYVHDVDFHCLWTELVILDRFDPPERRFAAGTAYLRGRGRGRVRAVHGVDELQRQIGHLVVEARLPEPGQPASSGYEGEGYVTVRHPDTEVVRDALRRIVDGVRVELVEVQ